METQRSRLEAVIGLSVVLGMVTGVLGVIAAVFAFFSYDWMAAGVCIGAAGLAFGLVANAVLRN